MTSKFFRPLLIVLCAAVCSALVASIGASAAAQLAAPTLQNPNDTAGAVTPTSVALTWSAVTGADHYVVRRETKIYKYVSQKEGKGDLISKGTADLAPGACPITGTTCTDTSVPPSNGTQTTYVNYKVRAVAADDKNGKGSNQAEVQVPRAGGTGPEKLTTPGNPSTCTATTNPVTFTFTFAPSTGGVAPISYIVRRTGGGDAKEFPIAATADNPVSFTDPNTDAKLKTNQTYKYKVKAVDAAGNISPTTRTPTARPARRSARMQLPTVGALCSSANGRTRDHVRLRERTRLALTSRRYPISARAAPAAAATSSMNSAKLTSSARCGTAFAIATPPAAPPTASTPTTAAVGRSTLPWPR